MGAGDIAYSAAATYGRIDTGFRTIFLTIFALMLLGGGFYMVFKHPPMYYPREEGVQTPEEEISKSKETGLGIALILFGILVIAGSWYFMHMTMKHKEFAAGVGTLDAFSDILSLATNN